MMKYLKRTVLITLFTLICMPSLRAAVIILASDQQLYDLMDPDKKIDMSLGHNPTFRSLREVCEEGQRRGDKELTIAYDEFFRQYRPQAGTERRLTPDMDEYVKMIRFISDFAKKYDLIEIENLKVNGHEISYRGKMNFSFRTDRKKRLIAFIGNECTEITLDQINYRFAHHPVNIAYLPTTEGLNKYIVRITGEGEITLPVPAGATKATLKNGKHTVRSKVEAGNLNFKVDKTLSGKWLDLIYR